jgi:hypothetical protein
LAAEGKTGEEIAAELGEPAATSYNRRRTYGGMDTDGTRRLGGRSANCADQLSGYDKGDPEGKLLPTPATPLARRESPLTSAI